MPAMAVITTEASASKPTSLTLPKKKRNPACDSCNLKKIKCDENQTRSCENCLKAGIVCCYNRNTKSGPSLKRTRVALNISNWTFSIPGSIPVQTQTPIPPFNWTPTVDAASPSFITHDVRIDGNQADYHFPFSFSAPNQTQTNSAFSSQISVMNPGTINIMRMGTNSLQTMSSIPNSFSAMSNNQSDNLLPKDAMNEFIDIYFQYFDPSMQYLHEKTFRKNVETESPLLLNAIYALSARYATHPSVINIGRILKSNESEFSINGGSISDFEARRCVCEHFYNKAKKIVSECRNFMQPSKIAALILLKAYCAASGGISVSLTYLNMAVNNLKELCQSTNSYDFDVIDGCLVSSVKESSTLTWLELEQRRRLWWACYVEDRFSLSSSDRSMIVTDFGDILRLSSIDEWVSGFPSSFDTPETIQVKSTQIINFLSADTCNPLIHHELFLHSILLSKILGRIIECSKMYKSSSPTLVNPDLKIDNPMTPQPGEFTGNPQIKYRLKLLEMALKSWQNGIPAYFDFSNLVWKIPPGNFIFPATKVEMVVHANLQIFYRMCTILLHKPKLLNLLRKKQTQTTHSESQQQLCGIANALCFKSCFNAACEIKQLIYHARRDSSNFAHFTLPLTAFALFQSALVHLISGQILCGIDAAVASVDAASAHLDVLKTMSCDWAVATKFHGNLKALIKSAQDVIKKAKTEGIKCRYWNKCGPDCVNIIPEADCTGDIGLNGFEATSTASTSLVTTPLTPTNELLMRNGNKQFAAQSSAHHFGNITSHPIFIDASNNPGTFFQMSSGNGSIGMIEHSNINMANSSIIRGEASLHLSADSGTANSGINLIDPTNSKIRLTGAAEVAQPNSNLMGLGLDNQNNDCLFSTEQRIDMFVAGLPNPVDINIPNIPLWSQNMMINPLDGNENGAGNAINILNLQCFNGLNNNFGKGYS
ncbi:hypothetical protein HK100_005836 [Physocladia obscura]|uniref:Zn(2)-C6 fungal-type domain-containing protein n=1 Tax=Physocladia obscura TaxID=109957 RepID=A0AAD5XC18_9FUNG|nr:hypothetical protein HK100_005836 [Physocladia obscura]